MKPRPRSLARACGLIATAGVLAFGVSACGEDTAGASDAPATTATTATTAPAAPVPAPSGEVILTLTGKVGLPNAGRTVRLDMAGIEAFGAETVELYEPFQKTRMSFRAVPLARVLDAAGVPGGAATLHAVALNDYRVDIPVDVARGDGVLLATADGDGSAIPGEDGGPIRIVFADGAPGADNDDYWIWSLARLDVR